MFWPGYCPRAWAYQGRWDAGWAGWAMMAYDMMQTGNLGVLRARDADLTARALAVLRVVAGEVSAIAEEAAER